MFKPRNFIEEKFNKMMAWSPVYIGTLHGRRLYTICWFDGTECDCYIDYDARTVELKSWN